MMVVEMSFPDRNDDICQSKQEGAMSAAGAVAYEGRTGGVAVGGALGLRGGRGMR